MRGESMITVRSVALMVVFGSMILGCPASSQHDADFSSLSFHEMESPSGSEAAEPNLTAGRDGRLYLSWVERLGNDSHRLMYSRRLSNGWAEPVHVSEGNDWFVNWADFPTLASTDSATVLASWLQKTGLGTYSYGVRVSISTDAGSTWKEPFFVHQDSTPTEHGFVSMVPVSPSEFIAVWLDGRETVSEGGSMTLRGATLSANGDLTSEYLLDPRVCDCCQTSATLAGDSSVVVVYRDRSDEEARDISCVRLVNGAWTSPISVHDDGWTIAGCPVNGPAISSNDSLVAVAWFTVRGEDSSIVNVAFSRDYGQSFGPPMRIDDGNPEGRVDVAFYDDVSIVVSWLERADSNASLMLRRVSVGGQMSEPLTVSSISSKRESGFPHLIANNDETLLAWTQTEPVKRIRVGSIVLE